MSSSATPSTPEERSQALEVIGQQVRRCTACSLHQSRTNAVPGTGTIEAEVMLVGEGPGRQEDLRGEPFVGPAGKFLDTLLEGIGLDREKVFITNVVKCRPPQNRDPRPEEAETCLPYLRHQFKLIQPRAVIILGRHALERMLPGVGPISQVHGQLFQRKGVAFMPVYHPAAALHNPALVEALEKDFERVKKYLEGVFSAEGNDRPSPLPSPQEGGSSEQLRLLD